MKIIELLYKEGKVFFYAVEKENTFVFGASRVEEPELVTEDTECFYGRGNKKTIFQKLIYEIEVRMKSNKSLVVLHTFENIKEEDRADFFHKLVEIATE